MSPSGWQLRAEAAEARLEATLAAVAALCAESRYHYHVAPDEEYVVEQGGCVDVGDLRAAIGDPSPYLAEYRSKVREECAAELRRWRQNNGTNYHTSQGLLSLERRWLARADEPDTETDLAGSIARLRAHSEARHVKVVAVQRLDLADVVACIDAIVKLCDVGRAQAGNPESSEVWVSESAIRRVFARADEPVDERRTRDTEPANPRQPDAEAATILIDEAVRRVGLAIAGERVEPYSERDDGAGMEASIRAALTLPSTLEPPAPETGHFTGGFGDNPRVRFVPDAEAAQETGYDRMMQRGLCPTCLHPQNEHRPNAPACEVGIHRGKPCGCKSEFPPDAEAAHNEEGRDA